MNPAVQPDLVPRRGNGGDVLRVQERRNAWDIEARGDFVTLHQAKDTRQARTGTVFALRQKSRGRFAVA